MSDATPGGERPRYQPRPVRTLAARKRTAAGTAEWAIRGEAYPAALTVGNLCMDLDRFKVTVAGREVALTCQEFDLLAQLVVNRDKLMPFPALTQWLWEANGRSHERRLRDVIHRLRSKLVGLEPHRIQAVPRRGYGIFEPTAQATPDEPARPMEELIRSSRESR
jgi:DNA-binding response OmpR family regulator